MLKELLEVELYGSKYLYDVEGNAFIDVENGNAVITFATLRSDPKLKERLGFQYDFVQMKQATGRLMILAHAIFDIKPKELDCDFLKNVFPSVSHVA
jgi:4-aminobutyrate aminotransferase-like enzyme